MQKRRHSSELKAKVVLEVLRGADTVNAIAKRYGVHPMVVTKWKKHVVDVFPSMFSRSVDRDKEAWAQRAAELFQQIGQLKYELDWVKKKAALLCE